MYLLLVLLRCGLRFLVSCLRFWFSFNSSSSCCSSFFPGLSHPHGVRDQDSVTSQSGMDINVDLDRSMSNAETLPLSRASTVESSGGRTRRSIFMNRKRPSSSSSIPEGKSRVTFDGYCGIPAFLSGKFLSMWCKFFIFYFCFVV